MANPEAPPLPQRSGDRIGWSGLVDGAASLAIARAAQHHDGLVLAVAANPCSRLSAVPRTRVLFERLARRRDVARLGNARLRRLLAASGHRVRPACARCIDCRRCDAACWSCRFARCCSVCRRRRSSPRTAWCCRSARASTRTVIAGISNRPATDASKRSSERGEFAVRGSLVDVYPMGSPCPYRIDLFDDEVASLRTFDPDTPAHHRADRVGRDPAGQGISADARRDRAVPQSLARTVRRRRASLSDLSGRQPGHGAVGHRVLPADVSRRARDGVRLSAGQLRRRAAERHSTARSRRSRSICARVTKACATTSSGRSFRRTRSTCAPTNCSIRSARCGRSCSTGASTASNSPRVSCPTFPSIIARITPATGLPRS